MPYHNLNTTNQDGPCKRFTLIRRILIVSILIFHLILVACFNGSNQEETAEHYNTGEEQVLTIATGPLSGIYYPIGLGIAEAIQQGGDYKISVLSTGASGENIGLITENRIELSITMGDAVLQAYEGFGAFSDQEPLKELRGLASLYPNFVQVVTTEDSGIEAFEDLKGRRVGVGAPGSGVELNARLMLEAHGMSYQDIEAEYLDYGEAIEFILGGDIDVAFVTSGIPNPTVKRLAERGDLSIIPIKGEGMDFLKDNYPFFSKNYIPAGTYSNEQDVPTATIKNLLLVNHDLPADTVYHLTKNLVNHVDYVQETEEAAERHIRPENMVKDMVVPFHDGAKRYYEEIGLIEYEN